MLRHFRQITLLLTLALLLAGCRAGVQSTSQTGGNTVAIDSGFSCSNVREIPTSECHALEAFYEATRGPGWTDDSGWLDTTTPCSWYGISCAGDHVDTIGLFFNNLRGELPPALAELTRLRVLDLHNNIISGEIPVELRRLTNLQYLDLGNNNLSGEIPAEFGELAALEWLVLPYNQLGGVIPAELGQIATLRNVDLSYNRLTGEIPDTLAELSGLEVLRLRNNRLSGEIPFELGQLPHLSEVELTFNQLTGTVPSALYDVPIHRLWGNRFENVIVAGNEPRQVNFLGVEFTLDPALADTVMPELKPARPAEEGPGLLWAPGEHMEFTFADPGTPREHAPMGLYVPAEAQLHIYPVAGLNPEVQPIVTALQTLLADEPAPGSLSVIAPETNATQPGLAMLPPSNAVQSFRAQVEYLSFAGGRGIRYLTQLSQGPVPISNYDLFYTFQGLTDDGATYVSAYFPVSVPALPASANVSEEAFATLMEDWSGYLGQTVELLNEQPAATFAPDLALIDRLISSLSAAGVTTPPRIEAVWPAAEEVVDPAPVLQWIPFPAAVTYHVMLLADAAYPPAVIVDEVVSNEALLAVKTPLTPGHYSWTVLALDADENVLAELTSTFSVWETLAGIAPVGGAALAPDGTLRWGAFPGATTYQVMVIDDDAYPPEVVFDGSTSATEITLETALEPGSYSYSVHVYGADQALLAVLNESFVVAE